MAVETDLPERAILRCDFLRVAGRRALPQLSGFLLESAVVFQDTHTVFGRAERVNEDELLGHAEHGPAPVFTPTKFSLGYIYDFQLAEHVKLGIGGLASRYIVPKGLDAAYGSDPTSFMTFIRLKIQ